MLEAINNDEVLRGGKKGGGGVSGIKGGGVFGYLLDLESVSWIYTV